MCSLMGFGELNIPSSRAFWDDCDEEGEQFTQTPEKLQLTFEKDKKSTPIASNLMFLVEGPNISDFAETTLLANATKLCALPGKNSALHWVESKNVLIAISNENLTNSGEITELLLPYAKLAKSVLTLTVKPKVDYKSEHIEQVREEITFLRGISTKLQHVKELETPNFITGVAAGIASWCENENLPISSYVAYTDNVRLDVLAAQPILQILRELGVDCAASYTPKLKDDSHLYS